MEGSQKLLDGQVSSEKTGHDRQVEAIMQTATDQSTAACHQLPISERTIQLLRKPADLIISTRRQTHRSTKMCLVDHSESSNLLRLIGQSGNFFLTLRRIMLRTI